MLTLITYPAGLGEPSISPFCIKSMIQLDMSGEAWKPEYVSSPSGTPFGRLPVLRTPEGIIPESGFIQSYLEKRGANFYPDLSTRDRALAHALIKMIEENLRIAVLHDRWLDDRSWGALKQAVFGSVPAPLRSAIANKIRRQMRAGLKHQGIARMSEAQRLDVISPDLECLTDLLWDAPYLFGRAPTAPDTIAVPILSMISGLPGDTALRRAVRGNATLMSYIERGRSALYPKISRAAAA